MKKPELSFLIQILILGMLISSCGIQKEKHGIKINETTIEIQPALTQSPNINEGVLQPEDPQSGAKESLETLMVANVPERDIISVTQRFKKIAEKKSQPVQTRNYRQGDKREFWVLDTTANAYQKILADLIDISPHSYFWVQQGVSFNKQDAVTVSDIFSEKIYPTNRAFFGSEPIPGIDGDERISILYTRGMGSAAGLFSSADSVTSEIDEYSNQAEMIYLSADYVKLQNHYYVAGILAHEFQHLIHFFQDRNEVSWISEGFSELATYINEYGPSKFGPIFAANPNLQLTFWPGDDQGDSIPHYGAAFMFMKYFLDRFGEDATRFLVAEKANGYHSVELVLEGLRQSNLNTYSGINGDELFRDWTIANLISSFQLDIPEKFKYRNYQPPAFSVGNLADSNSIWQKKNVKQYGTQYFEINCSSDCNLELQGQPIVRILPESPHSGDYYVWSNKGDESEMTLSREFDFRGHSDPITLQYWTWFDIEKDYDYLYLTASVDGENWKIIKTPGCTLSNPTGANYSCGYSGKSNRWIQEKVDLSEYAGKKVIIKFDYLTDLAVNGDGMIVDDISIPEIDYQEDFESGPGGWMADGFVRLQNQLPQKYLVSLIQIGDGLKVTPLFFDNNEKIQVNISSEEGKVKNFLVISGLTKYITTPAFYEIRLLPV